MNVRGSCVFVCEPSYNPYVSILHHIVDPRYSSTLLDKLAFNFCEMLLLQLSIVTDCTYNVMEL